MDHLSRLSTSLALFSFLVQRRPCFQVCSEHPCHQIGHMCIHIVYVCITWRHLNKCIHTCITYMCSYMYYLHYHFGGYYFHDQGKKVWLTGLNQTNLIKTKTKVHSMSHYCSPNPMVKVQVWKKCQQSATSSGILNLTLFIPFIQDQVSKLL